MSKSTTSRLLVLALLPSLMPLARLPAQTTQILHSQQGTLAERFGEDIDTSVDFDADGINDIVVVAPSATVPGVGTQAGTVTVFSGLSGAPMMVANGPAPSSFLGSRGAHCVRDLDGDSLADLATTINTTPGVAGGTELWVLSSADGSTLLTIPGVNGRIQSIGDYNGDGLDDFFWDGSVRNGDPSAAGAILFAGTANDVTPVGDVDGDGLADLADRTSFPPLIRLSSQPPVPIPVPLTFLHQIRGADDFDGDGVNDVLVFQPSTYPPFGGPMITQGEAVVFSPLNNQIIHYIQDSLNGWGGEVIAVKGLISSTGNELMVKWPPSPDLYWIYRPTVSTTPQQALPSFRGTIRAAGSLPFVEPAGDLNQDGSRDVVISSRVGASVVVEAIDGLVVNPVGLAYAHGRACPTSVGLPSISATGSPIVGQQLNIHAAGFLPSSPGSIFFGGPAQPPVPLAPAFPGSTCLIYVDQPVAAPITYDATGAFTLPSTTAAGSGLIGLDLELQYVGIDTALANPVVMSEGLRVRIGL